MVYAPGKIRCRFVNVSFNFDSRSVSFWSKPACISFLMDLQETFINLGFEATAITDQLGLKSIITRLNHT
jgi:hypothetical protein